MGVRSVSEIIKDGEQIPLPKAFSTASKLDYPKPMPTQPSTISLVDSNTEMEQDEADSSEAKYKDRPRPTIAEKNKKKKKD